jgi:N-acetylglucosamine-6-sulfatase
MSTITPTLKATRPTRQRTLGMLLALALMAIAASATVVATERPAAAADPRPNIILITTDDMALTDLRWMPQTRALIAGAGIDFREFISNHPVCCPARAELLTGQYAQNNGVHHNGGPWGGEQVLRNRDQHIGRWLSDAGYRTAFVGKYINEWEKAPHTPPGWTHFNPLFRGIYHPSDLTMWHDGQPRRHTRMYTADRMGQFAKSYVRSFAGTGDPFFIWVSQVPPHGMHVAGKWVLPQPAWRHRKLYRYAVPPTFSDPAYGERDVSDKPPYVRRAATLSRASVRAWHRARIRSLRAVDDQVKQMLDTLRSVGQLSRTYIFFTSDNGYMLGEHRLRWKNFPYEESLQVPLAVRGPGIPAKRVSREQFGLVDLAPTFLDIAGVSWQSKADGRSMLPVLRGAGKGYDHYLIQAGRHESQWWWRGIRSKSYVYVHYEDGFEELYDRVKDPHQLRNVARVGEYSGVLAEQRARLQALSDCAGVTCWNGVMDVAPEESGDAPTSSATNDSTPGTSGDGPTGTTGGTGGTTGGTDGTTGEQTEGSAGTGSTGTPGSTDATP